MRTLKLDSVNKFSKSQFILVLILILNIIILFFLNSGYYNLENDFRRDSGNNYNGLLENSDYWYLTPIFINGSATGIGAHNWVWAANQDWCNGSGTWNDPYVIENITINGLGNFVPIHITDSDKYFIIRNCTLNNSPFFSERDQYVGGILLENVSRAIIENNTCFQNGNDGIILKYSRNCTIKQNIVNQNINGITLYYSNNCTIIENTVDCNTDNGIELYYSNNSIIVENTIESNWYSQIALSWSNNIDVIKNKINNIVEIGMGIRGNTQDAFIFKNNISNGNHGIEIGGYNNLIKNNFIYNCTLNGITTRDYEIMPEIATESMNNTIIDNNCINISNNGISIDDSVINTFVRNNSVINSNSNGIIDRGDNSTLFNNKLLFSKKGIFKHSSADNGNYSNNIIKGCEVGIYFTGNGESHIIKNNELIMCGIFFDQEDSLWNLTSYEIDTSNKVNDNSIYFFANSKNLNTVNFTTYGSPGQIILINCEDSIISNFNIKNSSYNIVLLYSNNITLSNNNAINNTLSSFFLFFVINSNIINNNISSNNGNGLIVDSCFNLSFEHNLFQNNLVGGIYLTKSTRMRIENNTFSNNMKYGINFDGLCTDNDIIDNTITGVYQIGINIINSDNFNILNNKISETTYIGLNLESSEHIVIKDNLIKECNVGSNLNLINNLTIENNIISDNPYDGIIIGNSKEVEIINNIIKDNGLNGLHLSNTNTSFQLYNIIIHNNTFDNNLNSIWLGLNTYNITIDSNFISFSVKGIYLDNCYNSTFKRNNFTNNFEGIIISENSGGNLIYLNEFYSNIFHAKDDGSNNNWDNGTIGNYWDDYEGVDLNKDGIGDENYFISGSANSVDHYPIYKPEKEKPNPDNPVYDIITALINNLLSPISLISISVIITGSILIYALNRKKYYPNYLIGELGCNYSFNSKDYRLNDFINSDELLEFTPSIQDYIVSSISCEELKKIDQLDLPIQEKNNFIEELTNLTSRERKEIVNKMLKSQKKKKKF
ncbi:MAG: right-handed parallel beta-helix repeat-containing protein [Candidatus Lokiarchaeota archaeon]|nr:right-handed parallel beta-helix repeat-containing protein [Candidatus Lokiarchaeota archaeon]